MNAPMHYFPEPAVCISRYSTIDPGCDLAKLADAMEGLITGHLYPSWGVTVRHVRVGTPQTGEWPLYLFDHSDQAQAVGYHEISRLGVPQGKVFVDDALKNDRTISICLAHELVELLTDPFCNRTVMLPGGVSIAVEPADPVQGATFEVEGFQVCDFVYPSWYNAQPKAEPDYYDRLGKVKSPLQLLPDGYFAYLLPGDSRWRTKHGSMDAVMAYHQRKGKLSRPHVRAKHYSGHFADAWRSMSGVGGVSRDDD